MGCLVTKFCPEHFFQHTDHRYEKLYGSDSTITPPTRRPRVVTTLERPRVHDNSKPTSPLKQEDFGPSYTGLLPSDSTEFIYYGGGIPGKALSDDKADLPEYTASQPLHSKSRNGSLQWGSRCRAGSDFMRRRKENQDSLCICDCVNNDTSTTYFAVMDGHGPKGAFISQAVREEYLHILKEAISNTSSPASPSETSCKPFKTNVTRLSNLLPLLSSQMDVWLSRNSSMDISVSGTTFVSCLVSDTKLLLTNVGDSRAIVVHYTPKKSNRFQLHAATEDHKPDKFDERRRIEEHGGRVFSYGCSRVWLQDMDVPGLAMSRSLGDSVAKSIGVTCDPDVTLLTDLPIQDISKAADDTDMNGFIVLASDGVWEFLSNEEVMRLVGQWLLDDRRSPQEACDQLVEAALTRWESEDENVDDITAIVIVF